MLVVTLKKVPADQLVNEQNLIAIYIFVIGRSHCDYGMNRTSSTFHLYQCSVKAASIAAGNSTVKRSELGANFSQWISKFEVRLILAFLSNLKKIIVSRAVVFLHWTDVYQSVSKF